MTDLAVEQPHDNPRSAYHALNKALAVLAEFEADLPEVTRRFVMHGEAPDVLAKLMGYQRSASDWLGQPGRLWDEPRYADKRQVQAVRESQAARHLFYLRIAGEPGFDPLSLVRLGRVFEAVDGRLTLERPANGVPDWLQYLTNDMVWGTRRKRSRLPDGDEVRFKFDPLALLRRAAAAEGLDPLEVATLAFERQDVGDWYHDRYDLLIQPLSVLPLLDQLGEDGLAALVARLSTVGRLTLVGVIGRRELAARYGAALLRLAVDGSKQVRNEARCYLERIPAELRRQVLGQVLREGSAAEREQAVELLGQVADPACFAVIEAQRAVETSRSVLTAIQRALNKQSAMESARELEAPPLQEDPAIVGSELGESALAVLREVRLSLRSKLEAAALSEIEANKSSGDKYSWAQKRWQNYQKLTEDDLQAILNRLHGDKKGLSDQQRDTLNAALALADLPEFGLRHLAAWFVNDYHAMHRWWNHPAMQRWLTRVGTEQLDLRSFGNHFLAAGAPLARIAEVCLRDNWSREQTPLDRLPSDRIWPFFVEHPEFLSEAFGLTPSTQKHWQSFSVAKALALLDHFPSLPPKLIPPLFDLALGEAKTHRLAAQRVLNRLPDLGPRVVESLGSSKQELRASAANWLAELGDRSVVEPLLAVLRKESREAPRAAMLTALERLGVDISPFIAPELLLGEAVKGLKAKLPAGLAWFPFDALPPLKWADGSPVPAEIPRWWVVLACKLKEPGGNPLLTRYLGLLDASSRAALGSLVLRSFIHQDTRGPTAEESLQKAQAAAPARLSMYHGWARHKGYEHYGQMTLDQVVEELRRENQGVYLGSAIGEKGILALVAGMPGHEAVILLQAYMRDHYQRRAQIEAMLDALGNSDEPPVIQLLLAVSRRHRTASVQEKARLLVERVAARNGWSQEQLADRTIPSAGFDEHGVLTLEYGERRFSVTLDADLKPVLCNPDGKVVKSLPEPRKQDDPALIKEAKSQFSACKKELKQVLELQTARLYDAMCAGRAWPVGEWRDYLQKHPIVGRLVQRLVWLYDDGETVRAFRPTEDGSLIDVEDDEIELGEGTLRLAHAALLAPEAVKAWLRHFKDYKLKPLFPQLNRSLPELSDPRGQTIKDRQGWLSDAFTLRGHFNKLCYLRGEAWDGGFFCQYYKPFQAAGLRAVIEFSGNCLPEENVTAALKALYFERLDDHAYQPDKVVLAEVPPVLLAEVYADYHQLADACAGFEPDWEKKTPW
ncbi:DUF4132 domain-containing protein [Chitinimonas lacunae]|uniref:DUF4132 domain-containing protein n=1 Tax=Chitinimonas lacunae TaxID=1963018 RepID=A0ABV8MSG9_9NEIS